MKKILKWLLGRPITWLAKKISSAPKKNDVFHSLNQLLSKIESGKKNKGLIRELNPITDRLIIFSDQHKGDRDDADDFRPAEKNYLSALEYYFENGFRFVSLGDCEELWKYTPEKVIANNEDCFTAEKKFQSNNQYDRVFGNHDLEWKYKLQQALFLKPVFGKSLKVYEGLVFKVDYQGIPYSIFLAHGHQGDLRSDGNAFSAWVVANIWTPIQRYLQISINTPATSFALTDRHNIIMHEWSATKKNLIFISGHTHKPVFASMDHVDRLNKQLQQAQKMGDSSKTVMIQKELDKRKDDYAGKKQTITQTKPCYFNCGCCCFTDGDITGIEIAEGFIRLIKWHETEGTSQRLVLEEAELSEVFEQLQ